MTEPAISTEEIKENILKCDRCEQQFDSEDRVPRMLPCQHSFCTNCLDDVWTIGTKLSCPECSQQWDVRGSIAETFPIEYTAMKFVIFLELKAKKGRRLCTDCSEKTTATHHCLNCQVYICEEGLRAHKRFYKQKDHKILSIAEILKLPENYLYQIETCMLHPGSTLDLYCEKPTCMKPVCPSCAMIQHKERDGHEIRDLKDVVAEEKRDVAESLEDLRLRQQQNQTEKSELDRDLMFLVIESKRLESSIERQFNEFVRQASQQKEQLRSSLHRAVGNEREHIDACLNAFKTISQDQDEYAEYCRNVMADAKVGRFLREKEEMKQKLHALVNAPLPAKPDRKEVFVDLTSLSDSMNKMATIGEVVYHDHTTVQWKCVIEITDGVQEEELVVARVFLRYVGNIIVPPKPPLVKTIIEASSGMKTHGTLVPVAGSGDHVSTRSDELDSPDASRRNTKSTGQSNGFTNDDSGYQNSDSTSHDNIDYDRYEENVSPTNDRQRSYRNTPLNSERTRTRLSQRGSQKSIEVTSSEDMYASGRKDRISRASVTKQEGGTGSKVSFDERSSSIRSHTETTDRRDDNFNLADSEERSRSGATNKTGNAQEEHAATVELHFFPQMPGPHKVSFRIGGFLVDDDAFTFYSKEPGETGLDRSIHFLTWIGEDKVKVKSLKFPHIALSEDRLNRDQCTITNTGRLIKSPSGSSQRGESEQFTNYCGTTGTRCFSGQGVYYWHVTCSVRVLAKVAAFGKMILEVAIAHGDVLDNSYCVWETPRAWSLVISICSTHKAICIKAVCNSKVLFDKPILQCEEEANIDLDLGMMLDLDERRFSILDATTGTVMWAFEDIDTSKSLWPVFGVYNRYHFRVEVGVTSGDRLEVSAPTSRALELLLRR